MVALPVDVEALVTNFLRADADVAAIVGTRVLTRIPDAPVWPLVRLSRNGGGPAFPNPLWLDTARIQVEAWADFTNGKAVAWDLIAKCQRALHGLTGERPGYGVVSASETELGPVYMPDPDNDRPRYLIAVRVYVHPSAS